MFFSRSGGDGEMMEEIMEVEIPIVLLNAGEGGSAEGGGRKNYKVGYHENVMSDAYF